MPSTRFIFSLCVATAFASVVPVASAAGTLTSTRGLALEVLDHHVEVTINNGFARTEVTQIFRNPAPTLVEGVYVVPLPLEAALSEMTVTTNLETLYGEVVGRDVAEAIYAERAAAGESAGLATKEGYQRFEFRIASIPPGSQVNVTFAYYQPLDIDDGVGRYLYPLEDGGTGAPIPASTLDGPFTMNVTLRTAAQIDALRAPGFEMLSTVSRISDQHWELSVSMGATLNRDVVLYYDITAKPGQLELISYRPDGLEPGTFLMLLTPGTDLAPLPGADYVFVLDLSGSMAGKIDGLKTAVRDAIQSLSPEDRFRVVTFSSTASALTTTWVQGASSAASAVVDQVLGLAPDGGTNVYAGLSLALEGLNPNRASAVLLVTDGVANVGAVDGPRFIRLLNSVDVRVFGFLMGNNGNWPLMELITGMTAGFYTQVSNASETRAEILRARNKISHEALHDFSVSFAGGGVTDLVPIPSTVHYGEQVVVFGHYATSGPVTLRIDASVTGRPVTYTRDVVLPALATTYPELERLWALGRTRFLEYQTAMGLERAAVTRPLIREVGVRYQIVTDETAMILLPADVFARYGIDPTNRDRTLTEAEARAAREGGSVASGSAGAAGGGAGYASDPGAYSGGGYGGSGGSYGGGAVGEADVTVLALLCLLGGLLWLRRRS